MKYRVDVVFLAFLGLACGRSVAPDPGPPEVTPGGREEAAAEQAPGEEASGEEAPGEEAPVDCGSLSELACLTSGECTLVLDAEERAYLCRAAEGPCETGFRQKDGTPEACEANDGCTFVPGRCYCPPDVTCICGGGPPPRCADGA